MNKPIATPVFSRPAFVEAARKEFEALIAGRCDLEFVDALLVDLCGALRGKRMPVSDAAKLFESGMQIPLSVYLMDTRGEMTNPFGRGFGDGDPDGTAWPIPGTLSPVWGETPKRAQLLMTLHDAHGAPCDAEPRAALDGGADGLDAYRALAGLLPRLLKPGGIALLELGLGQVERVEPLFQSLTVVRVAPDLAGISRVLVLQASK